VTAPPPPRREVRDLLCEAAAELADRDTDGTTNDLRDRLIETGKRIIWEGTRP
jgi:hypothetical protein